MANPVENRATGPWYRRALFLGAWLCLALAGCDTQPGLEPVGGPSERTGYQVSRAGNPGTQRRPDTLLVASFNIQVFGQSKADKPEVMEILADVARRFDVLAIQEIRSKNQDVLPRLVERINARGARYGFVIGPRLGRTSSKEQYAYVYDTSRLEVIPDTVYTVPDPRDYLHRPPLVAGFRALGGSDRPPFTFSLVNIHTDPDETDLELDALDDAFLTVLNDGRGEDDVILLGDLNVDYRKLGELGQLPGITCTVVDQMTNTRMNKSYDNIVFDGRRTLEYTGNSGVLNLMSEYGLSEAAALEVSDHLPVWAEFSMEERDGAFLARQPEAARR